MKEHDPQLLNSYAERFVNRTEVYAQQTATGSYFLRQQVVTEGVIRSHLRGDITAGWYALAPDNTVRWVCLDADRADGLEQLQEAWKHLDSRGISSHLEQSRRGAHLWVFLQPLPAGVARQLV